MVNFVVFLFWLVQELPSPFVAAHGEDFNRESAFARALGGADQVTFGPQYDRHGEQVYDLYWAHREEVLAPDNRKAFIAASDGWKNFVRQYSLAVGDTVLMELASSKILQIHVFPRDLPYHDVSNNAEHSLAHNSASR